MENLSIPYAEQELIKREILHKESEQMRIK